MSCGIVDGVADAFMMIEAGARSLKISRVCHSCGKRVFIHVFTSSGKRKHRWLSIKK